MEAMDKSTLRLTLMMGIGLLIAGIYDLNLASWIYHPTWTWAFWLDVFGQVPSFILAALVLEGLVQIYDSVPIKTIGRLGAMILMGITAYQLMRLAHRYDWTLILGLGIGFEVALNRWFTRKQPLFFVDHPHFLWMAVVAFVGSVLLVQGLKAGWARPRYETLLAGLDDFSPWWLPLGPTLRNAWMSFPSGHSQLASFMGVLALHPRLKASKSLKWVLAIFIVSVMASRMVLGRHFLSDVIVGMGLTLLWIHFLHSKPSLFIWLENAFKKSTITP